MSVIPTNAYLDISAAAYSEIRKALLAADCDHAAVDIDREVIHMHGFYLRKKPAALVNTVTVVTSITDSYDTPLEALYINGYLLRVGSASDIEAAIWPLIDNCNGRLEER
jgi:hypothetical protein